MEKIDLNKIRGAWQESKERIVGLVDGNGVEYAKGKTYDFTGGDDTIESIKIVAKKINEVIDWIESKKDQLL